jgi:predicted nuclease of predicted toxin-antitoxin system
VRLLLDENCASRELQQRLRIAGHDVETTLEAPGAGVSDITIAAYASSERRVVVSKDTSDFARLYAARDEHPGVLLIFEDSSPRRLTAEAIVRAIRHIEATYACIDGMILALNDFQW